ncbi:hypothetical protein DV013_000385 [Vibrio parahaemolyticus]|nr:hypothetical protein [Vibrio parahaemolyticus]
MSNSSEYDQQDIENYKKLLPDLKESVEEKTREFLKDNSEDLDGEITDRLETLGGDVNYLYENIDELSPDNLEEYLKVVEDAEADYFDIFGVDYVRP